MRYNLAENCYVNTDTSIGNIDLNTHEIYSLLDKTFDSYSSSATVSGGEILCIDCDLGTRVHLYGINYYFNSDNFSDAVISGLSFCYKNELFEDYSCSGTISVEDNKYSFAPVAENFSPRYVRFIHTVNETISGTIIGFEILNEDGLINFGIDGTTHEFNVTTSLDSDDTISTVPVYNSGKNLVYNAYINIEPQNSNIDDVLSISEDIYGPWVDLKSGLKILGFDRWDYITTENVSADSYDNKLRQTSIKINNIHYVKWDVNTSSITTPPIYINPSKYSTLFLDHEMRKGRINPDSEDSGLLIESRHSNTEPLSYMFYRRLLGKEDNILYFKDYWLHNSAQKYEYTGNLISHTTDVEPIYQMCIDKYSNRWACILKGRYDGYTEKLKLFTADNLSDSIYSVDLFNYGSSTDPAFYVNFERIFLDKFGGVWIYFFVSNGSSSYWAQTSGYHLGYFSRGMTSKFHLNYGAKSISDCSVVYDTGDLWYCNSSDKQVMKINYNGVVLTRYQVEGTLYGITAKIDGGCWFIMDGNLYELDTNGELLNIVEAPGETTSLRKIEMDADDQNKLWFSDGTKISLFDIINNKVEFNVEVFTPRYLQVLRSGIMCHCDDNYNRYISKKNKRVEKEYNFGENRVLGVMESCYDEDNYFTKSFPIVIDTIWNSLPWRLINPETYFLPTYKYHQFRITIHKSDPKDVYPVSYDSTWNPDDDFIQDDGLPVLSRWDYNSNLVEVINNSVCLFGSKESDPYIRSYNKYFITKTCDFTLSFEFKDGEWPVNQYIYLAAYGVDTNTGLYNGEYFYIRCHKDPNTRIYLYVYVYNASYNVTYTDVGYTDLRGKMRLYTSGDNCYGNFYSYMTSSWVGASRPYINNLSSQYFYVHIYTTKGYQNLYLTNFEYNDGDAYVSADSTIISGMYVGTPVILKNIYPNNYKNIYLKTSTNNLPQGSSGNYASNLNVWWDIPV